MEEKIKYWVSISDYDLETASALLKTKRFLYVGFMCHQSIEKILKGFYVYANKDNPPYTHNLAFLAKQSGIYDKMTDEHKSIMDILEPLNIEARYPAHKEELMKSLNYDRCSDILKRTRELYRWIRELLPSK